MGPALPGSPPRESRCTPSRRPLLPRTTHGGAAPSPSPPPRLRPLRPDSTCGASPLPAGPGPALERAPPCEGALQAQQDLPLHRGPRGPAPCPCPVWAGGLRGPPAREGAPQRPRPLSAGACGAGPPPPPAPFSGGVLGLGAPRPRPLYTTMSTQLVTVPAKRCQEHGARSRCLASRPGPRPPIPPAGRAGPMSLEPYVWGVDRLPVLRPMARGLGPNVTAADHGYSRQQRGRAGCRRRRLAR
jgi:hypothetical protein